ASPSVVARMPSVRPRPPSSPASLPSFAADETHTPTRSRSGCASMPASVCRPTLPVAHCTTRYTFVSLENPLHHDLLVHPGAIPRAEAGHQLGLAVPLEAESFEERDRGYVLRERPEMAARHAACA